MTKEQIIEALELTIDGKKTYLKEIEHSRDVGSLAVKCLMPLWLADLNKILDDIRLLDTSN